MAHSCLLLLIALTYINFAKLRDETERWCGGSLYKNNNNNNDLKKKKKQQSLYNMLNCENNTKHL